MLNDPVTSHAVGPGTDMSREQMIAEHIIHEFDENLVLRNMRGCYGKLMDRFYGRLLGDVRGNRVLDVGCGFGQFGACCAAAGLSVHSIDVDDVSLVIARRLFGDRYHKESVYNTSLADGSVDTVVLNDVISHLDLTSLLREVRRLRAVRLIVHDSNISNPLLRLYRKGVGHEEYRDYAADSLVKTCSDHGLRCAHVRYVNFLALPISGGLQRPELTLLGRSPRVIDEIDRILERVVGRIGLDRWLAFRFLAVFDLPESAAATEREARPAA